MEGGRQAEVAKAILSAKNVPYVVAAPLLIQVRGHAGEQPYKCSWPGTVACCVWVCTCVGVGVGNVCLVQDLWAPWELRLCCCAAGLFEHYEHAHSTMHIAGHLPGSPACSPTPPHSTPPTATPPPSRPPQDMASWVRDGISGLQSVVLYALPELDGAIDTVPLGGLVGDNIYLVPERVTRLASRLRKWVALRKTPPQVGCWGWGGSGGRGAGQGRRVWVGGRPRGKDGSRSVQVWLRVVVC